MNTAGRIVLLNGVGSAGKSSIAKALQTAAAEPLLHVQMDGFMDMLPEAYQDHPDGFAFETVHDDDGKPMVVVTTGRVGERCLRGMRHAVAALAGQGNNLVVDDVMLASTAAAYAELLSGFDVFRVGVFAPLDVLETRERLRGDRRIGLARWQFDRLHDGMTYDLEIDTSRATPLACAERIAEKFRL